MALNNRAACDPTTARKTILALGTRRKVPFSGDLPYIGFMFKNTTRTYSKTELLIFLSPKIVDDKVSVT